MTMLSPCGHCFTERIPTVSRAAESRDNGPVCTDGYQFVAGLRADIKAKVAGREGDFEELLVKARFEEAKLRDLADPSPGSEPPKDRDRNMPDSGQSKCFQCGSTGHFVRLPFSRERRTKGGPRTRSFTRVANITPATETPNRKTAAELQRQLQEAEPDEALSKVVATMQARDARLQTALGSEVAQVSAKDGEPDLQSAVT